jgi:hypothetical protein
MLASVILHGVNGRPWKAEPTRRWCVDLPTEQYGSEPMPIILWLLGVPLSVVILLWLFGVV